MVGSAQRQREVRWSCGLLPGRDGSVPCHRAAPLEGGTAGDRATPGASPPTGKASREAIEGAVRRCAGSGFRALVHGYWFSKTSDIDLAVWGVELDDYLVAVARLQDLSSEFKIDLIASAHCKPALLDVIVEDGVRV